MTNVFTTPGLHQPGLAGYGAGPDMGAAAADPFTTGQLAGASLDLQFAGTGTLDPRITYTGGNGSYFNAAGVLTAAVTNAPRFDFDPVLLTPRGLLIEESRTNLLLNSATLATQSVTTTAVATTLSFYGTGTVTLSGSYAGTLVGAGAFPARNALTFTPTAGTLTATVTGSVLDAQLEAGAFVTSYIPTAGAAVTRAADVATMPLGSWFSLTAGTLEIESIAPLIQPNTFFPASVSLSDGTANNLINLFRTGPANVYRCSVITGGVAAFDSFALSGAAPVAGATARMAVTWSGTAWTFQANPGTGPTPLVTGSGAYPVALSVMTLGAAIGGPSPLDGYMRRVRFWPRAMSGAELQAMTT